jgi:hypothetical protein
MKNQRKPVMSGNDFLRDSNWNPRVLTRAGAIRLGMRLRDRIARDFGFTPVVADCGEYFRLSYGRKH